MRKITNILAGLAIVLAASAAWADEPRPDALGSKARQTLLKQSLGGSLAGDLNQNRQVWAGMKPEQVQRLRDQVYSFYRESDDKQAALLKAGEQFTRLSDTQRQAFSERAEWLSKVVAQLTPAQREQLKRLSPEERARRLLQLKAELATSQPSTQPSQPTTRPGAGITK